MLIFGFSLNMLTLLGLVLAIGIVVDDAIVVVENVERIMEEEKLSPYEATKKAMEGLVGAIIATSLVLAAVFVPVSFLSGITGQLLSPVYYYHRSICASVYGCSADLESGNVFTHPETSRSE